MPKVCSVLVAAAGRGSRAGLPYPKTLYPVRGKPILVRILELLTDLDPSPTVVVSPSGRNPIAECLQDYGLTANLVEQDEPKGMGDAILCIRQSAGYSTSANVLLIWGDIPFIQRTTVDAMLSAHFEANNDFTFVTAHVPNAYTLVKRDDWGQIECVIESREQGISETAAGERDVGLFIFRSKLVLNLLDETAPDKYGKMTGEHGFLYVIGHLASRGFKVDALPIATELDLVSLNSLSDLDGFS